MLSPVPSSIHVESNCNKSLSSIDGTSNPRSKETFSTFSDGSCGEPLFTQHLLIDFTPNEVIDNDIVQEKICAFWKLIHRTPEIKNLIVLPDKHTYTEQSSTTNRVTETYESESKSDHDQVIDVGRTAVSMLEFVKQKGLIDRTFEAKMAQSRCSSGSREYKENDPNTRRKTKKKPCTCTTICTPCPGLMKKRISEDDTPAKRLCTKMEAWDAEHPKSMKPPSHPPSLHYATMQRHVYQ